MAIPAKNKLYHNLTDVVATTWCSAIITTSPTWQELTKVIDEQNQKSRNTIDSWYKPASGIFAFLLVIVGVLGWRTVADVSTAVKTTAEQTAREVVQKTLEAPAVHNLVRETANSLLANGAFRDLLYAKAGELISAQISTPESRKLISDAIKGELVDRLARRTLIQSETIAKSLRSSLAGQVNVRAGNVGEHRTTPENCIWLSALLHGKFTYHTPPPVRGPG